MNIDDYVSINRVALKFVGLYPINIARYILSIVCVVLTLIPQVAQIYREWQNLTVVSEISSVLFTMVLAILKSIVWILNRGSLQPLIDFMLTDYWKIVESDGSKELEKYATYGKLITKGYMILMCNSLVFFFGLPIINPIYTMLRKIDNNSTKHFPFVAWYPGAFYTFPLYEITYVSQILAASSCAFLLLATDTLIATAVFHTCGHFKILQENLKQLDMNIYFVNDSTQMSSGLQKLKLQVTNIVEHHQVILGFCDDMEKNFSPMLLLQTMASSFIICLVALQVSTTLTERSEVIKNFSYLIMALFQLLLFCFPGDILISQSSNVSAAIYSIKWYNLPVALKTEMCMIVLRAQRPKYITAGKLYVMHLENFNAVISSALSGFMMLRSFSSDYAR